MLEHGIAVAKAALGGTQGKALTGDQIDGVQRFKAVLQLQPISTNVLHRSAAHGAGDQGQILQAGIPVVKCPGDQIVPVFPRTGLNNEGLGRFVNQTAAHQLDFEHQGFDVAG